ncbi:unnamed protein product [Choristocarpus tenellus]
MNFANDIIKRTMSSGNVRIVDNDEPAALWNDTKRFPYEQAHNGEMDAIHHWIGYGRDIDAPFPAEEWTPLMLACAHGNTDLARVLLDSGANAGSRVSTTVLSGHSPLHIASRYGHTNIVSLLIFSGAKVDERDRHGLTPLHYAAGNGKKKCVELLIATGSLPSIQGPNGSTALDMAKQGGYGDIVVLIQRSFDKGRERTIMKAWLESLDCEEYLARFFCAGYDDLGFIVDHGLTQGDLDCIGIPLCKLGLRRKLLALHNAASFIASDVKGEASSVVNAP